MLGDESPLVVIPEANFKLLDWVRSKNPRSIVSRWQRPSYGDRPPIDESGKYEKWLEDRAKGIQRIGPL